jgi:hypothetical protein
MHTKNAIVSSVAILLLGCTHSEPSLIPLGYGPLARAERRALATSPRSSTPTADRGANRAHAIKPEGVGAQHSTTVSGSRTNTVPDATAGKSEVPPTPAAANSSGRTGPPDNSAPRLEDWVGTYLGDDVTVFKTDGQSERRFEDPKARIRVERRRNSGIDLVLVDSSNQQDMCALSAEVEGDTAIIAPGQSCFLESEDEISAKSRPGKAVRSDKHLTLDLNLDTVMVNDEEPVTGSIEYHFDGRR